MNCARGECELVATSMWPIVFLQLATVNDCDCQASDEQTSVISHASRGFQAPALQHTYQTRNLLRWAHMYTTNAHTLVMKQSPTGATWGPLSPRKDAQESITKPSELGN